MRKLQEEAEQIRELRRQYILKYSDPMRERWDYIVMVASIYNSGWLPYEQSFLPYDHCNFSDNAVIDYLNYSIDLAFAFDIIINFNTSFVDASGEEFFDRKKIAYNYLSGMFVIDIMATVPFYEIFCIMLSGNVS